LFIVEQEHSFLVIYLLLLFDLQFIKNNSQFPIEFFLSPSALNSKTKYFSSQSWNHGALLCVNSRFEKVLQIKSRKINDQLNDQLFLFNPKSMNAVFKIMKKCLNINQNMQARGESLIIFAGGFKNYLM
jgi:hypothetical protein